ncbi:MAG: nucleotidyltransferase family protein [Bacteroidaceae bacterium]|nr:nucleotidyltransferase family protein [Bacteroidaceae bacterium]
MNNSQCLLVSLLIRKALNSEESIEFPQDTDWQKALDFTIEQGVVGICFEGIETLPANQRPSLEILAQWVGLTEQQSTQYEHNWAVARKLDKLWATEAIQAVVIKGRSIAQYYPVPSHRYSCDLDLFIRQGWEQACKMLEGKGLKLEYEVYKEAEFTLNGVYVECHRYITPVRGNKLLQKVERYLYSLLDSEPKKYFEGATLVCPPLMFTLILYIEHALGDLQQGKLLLKHIVDWIVLRKQDFHWKTFETICKEFMFDRFLSLIDALADVIEGKRSYESLPPSYRRVYDDVLSLHEDVKASDHRSWFRKRVNLFFKIMKNNKNFRDFSYTTMPQFLFYSVWTHFINKEVRL